MRHIRNVHTQDTNLCFSSGVKWAHFHEAFQQEMLLINLTACLYLLSKNILCEANVCAYKLYNELGCWYFFLDNNAESLCVSAVLSGAP